MSVSWGVSRFEYPEYLSGLGQYDSCTGTAWIEEGLRLFERDPSRPSIKPGTWNIPEHPGTRKKKNNNNNKKIKIEKKKKEKLREIKIKEKMKKKSVCVFI